MMYPFLTLDDNTEIVHSHQLESGQVKVFIETPVQDGFHSAICYLPDYKWDEINGYSQDDIVKFQDSYHTGGRIGMVNASIIY